MALGEALLELQQLTERLRRDCPWDREQTARTIVPHTVEEAYEVADAALVGDPAKLLDDRLPGRLRAAARRGPLQAADDERRDVHRLEAWCWEASLAMPTSGRPSFARLSV